MNKVVDIVKTLGEFSPLREITYVRGNQGLLLQLEGLHDAVKNFNFDPFACPPLLLEDKYGEQRDRVVAFEKELRGFIDKCFTEAPNTDRSIQLLDQFRPIMIRESLRGQLEKQYTTVFHNYAKDLIILNQIFEKRKQAPPIPRNTPPTAGAILWVRQLLRLIDEPMKSFQKFPRIYHVPHYNRVIRTFKNLARVFVDYERHCYQTWNKVVVEAMTGLRATLLVQHPTSKKLYVNFDRHIIQVARETKFFQRLGLTVPVEAIMLCEQLPKFVRVRDELHDFLQHYERVLTSMHFMYKDLLAPRLVVLNQTIKPLLVFLTWTSTVIDKNISTMKSALSGLENLIEQLNSNLKQIESGLDFVEQNELFGFPSTLVAADEFVSEAVLQVHQRAPIVASKMKDIESAVQRLLHVATEGYNNKQLDGISSEKESLRACFAEHCFNAVITLIERNLRMLKSQFSTVGTRSILYVRVPIIQVGMELVASDVAMVPSLEEIQACVTQAAKAIIQAANSIPKVIVDADRGATYFYDVARDRKIVKVSFQLTGTFVGIRKKIEDHLNSFDTFSFLWKNDKRSELGLFLSTNPELQDYERMIKKYHDIQQDLKDLHPIHNIETLCFCSEDLKLSLQEKAQSWKNLYGISVLTWANKQRDRLHNLFQTLMSKLKEDVEDLRGAVVVMDTIREFRTLESKMEIDLAPVLDAYDILKRFDVPIPVDEQAKEADLQRTWETLKSMCEVAWDQLCTRKEALRDNLGIQLEEFKETMKNFEEDYRVRSPFAPEISVESSVERLEYFWDLYHERKQHNDYLLRAQHMFGIHPVEYPLFFTLESQLKLASLLFGLYTDVLASRKNWAAQIFQNANLRRMEQDIHGFESRLKELPPGMAAWKGYSDLQGILKDWADILPYLIKMSHEAIKQRHWQKAGESFGIPADPAEVKVEHLLQESVVVRKDEIEELHFHAAKELEIENKVEQIKKVWTAKTFAFAPHNDRKEIRLESKSVTDVTTYLEETQMVLHSLLNSRYNSEFRREIMEWITKLNTISESTESILGVQSLWLYLEAVFSAGDVARQLPAETKRFQEYDGEWSRIMASASCKPGVMRICLEDKALLLGKLPHLRKSLEALLKYLSVYLEEKRNQFSRFFFMSDRDLLNVLSKGSDPQLIVPYIRSMFDNIHAFQFERRRVAGATDCNVAVSIISSEGERVPLESPVVCEGNTEAWLINLLKGMQSTIRKSIADSIFLMSSLKLEDFVFSFPAQVSMFGLQWLWTKWVEEGLSHLTNDKNALANKYKKIIEQGKTLVSLGSQNMSDVLRRRIIAMMITTNTHQREVVQTLLRENVNTSSDFTWMKYLRCYWNREQSEEGDALCRVTDLDLAYGNEYVGCRQRLVVTSLTERCYISMAQALSLTLGSAPTGPAGTGKTETIKELGHTLGKYVIIFNCSVQMDQSQLGKIFKGIAQSGAWGNLDEFNRVQIDALSVASQQVSCVLNGLRAYRRFVIFPDGSEVRLKRSCGIFTTLNPWYSGRQELPENLQALFRTVAMIVPDFVHIVTVRLAASGFHRSTILAKKFCLVYSTCEQQLSKQPHYDFGLRNMMSVLMALDRTRHEQPSTDEDDLWMQTIRDANLPKLLVEDKALFLSILADIFPESTVQGETADSEFSICIEQHCRDNQLLCSTSWRRKTFDLYQTMKVRHGTMVVGPSNAGKSEVIIAVAGALERKRNGQTIIHRINPKSITLEQMYGRLDPSTQIWTEGIFTQLWRDACKFSMKEDHWSWLVLDGPVDPLWIENLNSVLDNSKVLALANGDRLAMVPRLGLLFEVENLLNASPATVSRTGIVYMSSDCLDWRTVVDEWVLHHVEPASTGDRHESGWKLEAVEAELYREWFEKFLPGIFSFYEERCSPVLEINHVTLVKTCLTLLQGILQQRLPPSKNHEFQRELLAAQGRRKVSVSVRQHKLYQGSFRERIKKYWIFAVVWGIGGILDQQDRRLFHAYLRYTGWKVPESEGEPEEVGIIGQAPLPRPSKPEIAKEVREARAPVVSPLLQGKPFVMASARHHNRASVLSRQRSKVPTPTPSTNPTSSKKGSRAPLTDAMHLKSLKLDVETISMTAYDFFLDERGIWCAWDSRIAEWSHLQKQRAFWQHFETYRLLNPHHTGEVQTLHKLIREQVIDPLPLIYAEIFIPTVDSIKAQYLIDLVLSQQEPVLLVGEAGCSKTATTKNSLRCLVRKSQSSGTNVDTHLDFNTTTFHAASSLESVHILFESLLVKRSGHNLGPAPGTRMVLFIDDINLPSSNKWGHQVTNELMRQIIELNQIYSIKKPGQCVRIRDVQYIAAMSLPQAGRNDLPSRLKGKFNIIHITNPSSQSLNHIFSSILEAYLTEERGFNAAVRAISAYLPQVTLSLWEAIKVNLVSTPGKLHYGYNMHHLARLHVAITSCSSKLVTTTQELLCLWLFECERIFSDSLVSSSDKNWLRNEAINSIFRHLNQTVHDASALRACLEEKRYYAHFLGCVDKNNVSRADELSKRSSNQSFSLDLENCGKVPDTQTQEYCGAYRSTQRLSEVIEDLKHLMHAFNFNNQGKGAQLNLVFFEDAVNHLLRICRVLRTPQSNMILVGVGGSGKRSLTQLAAFICGHKLVEVPNLEDDYNITVFLNEMYRSAGMRDEKIALLVCMDKLKNDSVLKHLSVAIAGEEISMFTREHLDAIASGIESQVDQERQQAAKKQSVTDSILSQLESRIDDESPSQEVTRPYSLFLRRIRANMHVVFCASPGDPRFLSCGLRFPRILSSSVIDWVTKWPRDALKLVAESFISDADISIQNVEHVSEFMALAHAMVEKHMLISYRDSRCNVHLTSRSYILFVRTFLRLFSEKHSEISAQSLHLRTGILKLEKAENSIEQWQVEQKEKSLLMGSKTQEVAKMIADMANRKTRSVEAHKLVQVTRDAIAAEIIEIERQQRDTEAEIVALEPVLEAAASALTMVKQKDINLLKTLTSPHNLIQRMLDVVLIFFREPLLSVEEDTRFGQSNFPRLKTSWKHALVYLRRPNFLDSLHTLPKDTLDEEQMELVRPYLNHPDFNAEKAEKASSWLSGLCDWILAMVKYQETYKLIQPKREKLTRQQSHVEVMKLELERAVKEEQQSSQELEEIAQLYDQSLEEKQKLHDDIEKIGQLITKTLALISGLNNERERWKLNKVRWSQISDCLLGNVSLNSAFIAYMGPFSQTIRQEILAGWRQILDQQGILHTHNITPKEFLAEDAQVRQWKVQGLSHSEHAIQNAIIMLRSSRYPLVIDPEEQALAWITKQGAECGLCACSVHDPDYLGLVKQCLENGIPLLLKDVDNGLPSQIATVAEQRFASKGGKVVVCLEQEEVEVANGFQLYLMCRTAEPRFSPVTFAQVNVINFALDSRHMEDLLLGRIVSLMKPQLEDRMQQMRRRVLEFEYKKSQLESDLLCRLSAQEGDLLEDYDLLQFLNRIHSTSLETAEKIAKSREAKNQLEEARQAYQDIARRGSLIYSIAAEFKSLNPIYSISLSRFLLKFDEGLQKAENQRSHARLVQNCVHEVTLSIYNEIIRALGHDDVMTFQLFLALQISVHDGAISTTELDLLLKLRSMVASSSFARLPAFLSIDDWTRLNALSQLPAFQNLLQKAEGGSAIFEEWIKLAEPEGANVPHTGEDFSVFHRLLLVTAIRPDRTLRAAIHFIEATVGHHFALPPTVNFYSLADESNLKTPIICFVDSGSDPTATIAEAAVSRQVHLEVISMGKGQEARAKKLIESRLVGEHGSKGTGGWILLQNCHLSSSLLVELQVILSKVEITTENQDVRLWLTMKPEKNIPTGLLQMATKICSRPAQGMKYGLTQTFESFSPYLLRAVDRKEWRPILFAISFLHCAIIERRKFGARGWNVPYFFNQSDLVASIDFTQKYLYQEEGPIKWDFLVYVVCEIMYGGQVTDAWDRRTLRAIGEQWLRRELLEDGFEFAPGYPVPKCDTNKEFLAYFNTLPHFDDPRVFGLGSNSEKATRQERVTELFASLRRIQPTSSDSFVRADADVALLSKLSQIQESLPQLFDLKQAQTILSKADKALKDEQSQDLNQSLGSSSVLSETSNPYDVILWSEIRWLQSCLITVKNCVKNLQAALTGITVMTRGLDAARQSLLSDTVPEEWHMHDTARITSLGGWLSWIGRAHDQFHTWLHKGRPLSFWLGGFHNPKALLIALKQHSARKSKQRWGLDEIEIQVHVTRMQAADIHEQCVDGMYIHGFRIEGCVWDWKRMEFKNDGEEGSGSSSMPVLHVVPRSSAHHGVGTYECPVYRCSKRGAANFITSLLLPDSTRYTSGKSTGKWIRRGVALICDQ